MGGEVGGKSEEEDREEDRRKRGGGIESVFCICSIHHKCIQMSY